MLGEVSIVMGHLEKTYLKTEPGTVELSSTVREVVVMCILKKWFVGKER
jgi:hypothetical protein